MTRTILYALLVASAFQTIIVFAEDKSKMSSVTDVKDVETLNDDLRKYNGKRIRVEGNVDHKIDSRAFLLESGGLFNDKIVVLTSPKVKNLDVNALDDDKNIRVTGTLVTKSLATLRKDYSWDLTENRIRELRNAKTYLVADEISPVEH